MRGLSPSILDWGASDHGIGSLVVSPSLLNDTAQVSGTDLPRGLERPYVTTRGRDCGRRYPELRQRWRPHPR